MEKCGVCGEPIIYRDYTGCMKDFFRGELVCQCTSKQVELNPKVIELHKSICSKFRNKSIGKCSKFCLAKLECEYSK